MTWDEAFTTHGDALAEAFVELESAAWSRQWTRLQAARVRIKQLTSIEIKGKLRKELEHEAQQLKAKRLA